MGIRKYNAYTLSGRHMANSDFRGITKDTPEKSLAVPLNRKVGYSSQGKTTVHHRDGSNGREYRIVDFKRNSKGSIPAIVIGIGYDPDRTVNIVLICYADGEKAYILVPQDSTDGMKVMSDDTAKAKLGNCMPLCHIPVGIQVHNIKLYPGRGGQLVRSAGNPAQLVIKEGGYATLRLPLGEMRMVPIIYHAATSAVDNGGYPLISIGKAGRRRNMGIRPTVHGSIMNPDDRPHGGGGGKCSIGRPSPYTSWDGPTPGLKTRRKNKQSNKLIIRRRDGRTTK